MAINLALEYLANSGALRRWKRPNLTGAAAPIVAIVGPADYLVAAGTVALVATVTGATRVTFRVGSKFQTGIQGPVGTWTYNVDTTKEVNEGTVLTKDQSIQWRATAVFTDANGVETFVPSESRQLTSNNFPVTGLPVGGWRPAQAWAADYSSLAAFTASHERLIGWQDELTNCYSIVPDPTGRPRNVAKVTVPDPIFRGTTSPKTQPTTKGVRAQAQSPRDANIGIKQGDELCIAFTFMMGPLWPTIFGPNTPGSPDTSPANGMGFINIFQHFGPDNPDGSNTYLSGSMFTIGVSNYAIGGSSNEFSSQDTYAGNDGKHIVFPFLPLQPIDIVIKERVSVHPSDGYVEMYCNYGQATTVQPLYIGGKLRIPRALRRNLTHQDHRTDTQVYRRTGEIAMLEAYFSGHKYGPTVASVDPLSYA